MREMKDDSMAIVRTVGANLDLIWFRKLVVDFSVLWQHGERRRLPTLWRLGFEEKLGFLMGEMKMMTCHHLVG